MQKEKESVKPLFPTHSLFTMKTFCAWLVVARTQSAFFLFALKKGWNWPKVWTESFLAEIICTSKLRHLVPCMGAIEQLVFNCSDYCVDSVLCRDIENSNEMIFIICELVVFMWRGEAQVLLNLNFRQFHLWNDEIRVRWIIDNLSFLLQTKCLWNKEQCLLLPRLEDSHRGKPVHCSWVSSSLRCRR